jgi:hypothetical protein
VTQPVSVSVFKRTATVAYDRTNFSILSIEKISKTPIPAMSPDFISDYLGVFKILFPAFPTSLDELTSESGVSDADLLTFKGWESVGVYYATAFGAQLELFQVLQAYKDYFPTWSDGPRQILEGILTVPIQFGIIAWEGAHFDTLPSDLQTTASLAQVSYRAVMHPLAFHTFVALLAIIILWAISCLLWVQRRERANVQVFPIVEDAFNRGNPFKGNTKGFWDSLCALLGRITSSTSKTKVDVNGEVFTRTLGNGIVIAVDWKGISKKEDNPNDD